MELLETNYRKDDGNAILFVFMAAVTRAMQRLFDDTYIGGWFLIRKTSKACKILAVGGGSDDKRSSKIRRNFMISFIPTGKDLKNGIVVIRDGKDQCASRQANGKFTFRPG